MINFIAFPKTWKTQVCGSSGSRLGSPRSTAHIWTRCFPNSGSVGIAMHHTVCFKNFGHCVTFPKRAVDLGDPTPKKGVKTAFQSVFYGICHGWGRRGQPPILGQDAVHNRQASEPPYALLYISRMLAILQPFLNARLTSATPALTNTSNKKEHAKW